MGKTEDELKAAVAALDKPKSDDVTLPFHEWLSFEGKAFDYHAKCTEEYISVLIRENAPVTREIAILSVLLRSHATLCAALAQHPSIKFMQDTAENLMEKELPTPPDV